MMNYFKSIRLNAGVVKEPEWGDSLLKYVDNFMVQVIDMKDKAIVDAIIRTATEEGVGEIVLIDKKFVLEAIKEKLERERGEDHRELF